MLSSHKCQCASLTEEMVQPRLVEVRHDLTKSGQKVIRWKSEEARKY